MLQYNALEITSFDHASKSSRRRRRHSYSFVYSFVKKPTTWADTMGWRPLLHPSALIVLTDEEEVRKHLTRHSKVDASMKLTALGLKGQCELTTLIKGYLPPTYRAYKEITCSPCLVKSKGIPIRKGSRKIRPKEVPKKKRLLIQQGDVNTLLL